MLEQQMCKMTHGLAVLLQSSGLLLNVTGQALAFC
jgi:hypothetical protein